MSYVQKKKNGNGSWAHMEESFLDLVLIAIKLIIKNVKAEISLLLTDS